MSLSMCAFINLLICWNPLGVLFAMDGLSPIPESNIGFSSPNFAFRYTKSLPAAVFGTDPEMIVALALFSPPVEEAIIRSPDD